MKILFTIIILLIAYLGIIIIFYHGIKTLFLKKSKKTLKIVWIGIDLILTLTPLLFITYFYFQIREEPEFILYTKMFYSFSLLFLTLIPKLVFSIIQITIFLVFNILNKIFPFKINYNKSSYISFFIGLLVFISMLSGILFGKTNIKTRELSIESPALPQSFNSLRIVQISDLHLGSFCNDTNAISKAVNLINQLKPDIVLLTGDLVNNYANEANHLSVKRYRVLAD